MTHSEYINNEFFVHHIDTLVITQQMYTEQEILQTYAALQAATILVAMASEKKNWRPKFWRKSPIGNQQIERETYLKDYQ